MRRSSLRGLGDSRHSQSVRRGSRRAVGARRPGLAGRLSGGGSIRRLPRSGLVQCRLCKPAPYRLWRVGTPRKGRKSMERMYKIVSMISQMVVIVTAIGGVVAVVSGYVAQFVEDYVEDAVAERFDDADLYLREFAEMERSPGGEMNLDNTIHDVGWGEWSNWAYCPEENHYICGLSQRVYPPGGSDVDDTAMAGIKFKCCPLIPDRGR